MRRYDRTDTARRTIYEWPGWPSRVIVSRSLFGLPPRVVVVRRRPTGGEVIVSRHRSVREAITAARGASNG